VGGVSIIMRVEALASVIGPPARTGLWLKAFDNEARDGRGSASFTDDPREALRFPDLEAAFEAWKSQSRTQPLRPDGRPNRPLTAYSVTFDTIADEPADARH
jgi:hypothetical protein